MTAKSVVIRQTRQTHAELQSLFDQVAAASTGRARLLSPAEKAEQMMIRKLQTPSAFPEGPITLPDLVEQLLTKNGVPCWIDEIALSDEGIKWKDLSSTIGAKKMSPAARLDAVMTEHTLSWRVADEVVQITTATKANEQLFVRVYDVRRVVSPNRPMAVLLVQLTSNNELGQWIVNDGEGGGTMALGNLLVIRQTAAVHAKLAKLLN